MLKTVALAALIWAAFSMPGEAQMITTRDEAVKHLEQNYGEVPVARGLAANGGIVEVFVSQKGSWTLILTLPNGIVQMIGAGTDWHIDKPKPKRNPGDLRLDKTGFSI